MTVPFGSTTHSLPREILELISLLLVAQDPLGTPSSLVPLLLTSRSINAALRLGSGTQLYAKICRLKFDCSAVERRAGWRPGREELEGHLVQMCELLRWLRKAGARRHDASGGYAVDTELDADVESQLLSAYVAMMDDDGRNRAQFKHAGIQAVVDRYVRRRLYDGLEHNGNWPQPSPGNSCALWVWWMFTTRESLLKETKEEKEEIIRLVFPFMVNTARYAAALAPPTHFTLPLGPSNPVQKFMFTRQTPHGAYPLYPTSTPGPSHSVPTISHPAPNSPHVLYYFNTAPSFVPPLIAPAAILLYWSRREIHGFFKNPHLPATRADVRVNDGGVRDGLTQGDLEEFNRHKTAKLRGEVEWDWDVGHAVLHSLQPDGTLTKTAVKEGEEPSREWDLDVARARLCGDVCRKQPKWRMGSVYKRGMMSGVWAGVQFTSSAPSIDAMLSQAHRSPDFNEQNIIFGARPLIVRLKEHGFVRTPATSSVSVPVAPSKQPAVAQEHNAKVPPAAPIPTPMTLSTSRGTEVRTTVNLDGSLNNAWFPGGVGTVRWVPSDDAFSTGVLEDRYAPSSLAADEEAKEKMGSTMFIVDEGAGRGGPGVGADTDGMGGPVGRLEAVEAVRRGAKVSVYERFEVGKEGVHERLLRAKESGAILGPGGVHTHEGVVRHPGCQRCEEREAFLEEKEVTRERRRGGLGGRAMGSKMVRKEVEEVFASVGLGKGEELRVAQRGGVEEDDDDDDKVVDVDFDDEYEEEESGDDDDDMDSTEDERDDELELVPISPSTSVPPSRSVSVEPNPDSDSASTVRPHSSASFTPDDSEDGDADVDDEPEALLPTRLPHSPMHIEPCDHGVEDTLLTGDLSESHRLAWGKSVWYGRVRPWDGLVGVLRVAYDRNDKPNAYMIYYGYVYGGDTWVGNWRVARGEGVVADPLLPGFESAFVMSRRE